MIDGLSRYRPRFDLLRTPVLGRFLLWKHSRTALQIPLFLLAAIMIVDGLVGSQLAAKNVATVAAWVHYRGLVVVTLLLAGNLFCAGCPFLLPRKLARWLGRPSLRWPQALRNKWAASAGLIAILWVYEVWDLWASPWLTAWVAVAYFAAAFVIEAIFSRDSFCLYVCPLGAFNFLYSTASPLQITNRSLDVCRTCVGRDCINGRYATVNENEILLQQGCQLELFVPTIQSNMNCTLCLDCAKACPHDNVALIPRRPGDELFRQSWPKRLDLALLALFAAAAGMVNAFAMTPPVYALEIWLAGVLNTQNEGLVLALVFLAGVILIPLGLAYAAAWLGRLLAPGGERRLDRLVMAYAYAFVPLGLGVWTAHYLFHFLIGAFTIVPALQQFFANTVGLALLGQPNWQLAADLSADASSAFEIAAAMESYLRTIPYDLDVGAPPSDVADVADYFLFDLQRGYCDYYATAFIVLARLSGLPARFATGYAVGAWDDDAREWTITEAEAHSWPEVYFPQAGWVACEPTAGRPPLTRWAGTGSDDLPVPQITPAFEPFQAGGIPWNWQMLFWLLPMGLLVAGIVSMIWRWRLGREDAWLGLLLWGGRLGRPALDGETELEYGQGLTAHLAARPARRPEAMRTVQREILALSQEASQIHYGPQAQRPPAQAAARNRWRILRNYLVRLWWRLR